MRLLAFPCNPDIAKHFLNKVDTRDCAALILAKQEHLLRPLLSGKVSPIFVLDEELYGKVTSPETARTLVKIKNLQINEACFPLNDFCGNVALLLAPLAESVKAINATSEVAVELCLQPAQAQGERNIAQTDPQIQLPQIQARIVERLEGEASLVGDMARGSRSGERPTQGLIQNHPYDSEVLARYAHAARGLRGDVLEIGCGIGCGAYLMAELNPDIRVRALDFDQQAINLAIRLWHGDRVEFDRARAEQLPFPAKSFDTVICFEVIEHLHQPDNLLAEVSRVLKPGGKLIGSTPNFRLYPYRVNKLDSGAPEDLRESGVWPWHLQEFDEVSISTLMRKFGFTDILIKYPTFVRGIEVRNTMMKPGFENAIQALADLNWSAADFAVLENHVPCFSGFSFIFAGGL